MSPRILSKSISTIVTLGLLASFAQAQTTRTWDGGAGTNLIDTAANWSGDVLPGGAAGDTAQWDGTVAGDLALIWGGSATVAASPGISLNVLGTNTGALSIDSSGATTTGLRLGNVTLAAGAGAFTLGDGIGTRATVSGFNITLNGGSTTSTWTNNTSNTATIKSDVGFTAGGGVARTLALTGSGNWAMEAAFGLASGSGSFALTKSGAGTLTLSGPNNYTGTTNLSGGRLILAHTGAFGTSGQLNFAASTGTTVEYAVDAAVTNAIATNSNTGFSTTFVLNRATAGDALNQTLGAGTYGGGTVNVQAGANVTSGTPRLTYNSVGLTSGSAGSTVLFNPTSANITINSASITGTANAKNLGLGGTSTGNVVQGVIGNGIAGATLSLVKSDSGTWTLNGTSNYTGATTVNGGTLAVDVTGSINGTSGITINGAGARFLYTSSVASSPAITQTLGTLDGAGTVGAVTVANDAANVVTNGNGGTAALTLASLTFNGAATLNPAVNGGPGIVVTGALTTTPANGTVTLGGSGVWTNGLNDLISFGSFSGGITDFTKGTFAGLTGRQSADELQLSGNAIAINIIGDNPLWTGANGGILQQFAQNSPTSASPAWELEAAGIPTDFWVGDNAVFDDTAAGTTTVTIQGGDISPTSLTFNNSAKDYTVITDDGSVIGAGVLSKNGSGALTITTANTYAGGTTLNEGTLNVNNVSALGTGAVTITGGTLDNTSGAALTLSTNNAQNWNGDLAFAGAADGTHDLDLGTGLVVIVGAGTERVVTVNDGTFTVGEVRSTTLGLTKQGAGTLVLTSTGVTGANDGSRVAGVLNAASGTLQINRTGAAAADSGDLTVAGVAGNGTIVNGAAVERWLVTNSAGNHDFTGTLANGGTGALGFSKSGAGTQTLSGALSYTGATTVTGGTLAIHAANTGAGTNVTLNSGATLVLGNTQALGAASLINLTPAGTGTLRYITDGGDTAYQLTMSSGSTFNVVLDRATAGTDVTHNLSTATSGSGFGSGTINFTRGANVSGTATASFNRLNLGGGGGGTTLLVPQAGTALTIGSVTKSSNATVQTLGLDGVTTGNVVTGTISNGATATFSVTKSNTSTWTLSGTSTYTGATTITGGTLILNGSLTGTGNVNVNAGTLAGIGSVAGVLAVGDGAGTSDAVIAPGDAGIGAFSTTNNVTFGSDAVFALEINTDTLATDLLTTTGTISLGLGVATLNVSNLGFASLDNGETFTFMSGTGGLSGNFAGLPDGAVFGVGSNFFEINYTASSVELIAAIPEPASLALVLGGTALLGLRRNRRREV